MDVSEIWIPLKYFPAVLGTWLAVFSGRFSRVWLRRIVRLFSIPLALFCGLISAFMMLVEVAWVHHSPVLPSPGGTYVAVTTMIAGSALDDDSGVVRVRCKWCPCGTIVYSGAGSWDHKTHQSRSPVIRWLNDSTIEIRHWDKGTPCVRTAGNVRVVCTRVR